MHYVYTDTLTPAAARVSAAFRASKRVIPAATISTYVGVKQESKVPVPVPG